MLKGSNLLIDIYRDKVGKLILQLDQVGSCTPKLNNRKTLKVETIANLSILAVLHYSLETSCSW